jgi:hypothetical protein
MHARLRKAGLEFGELAVFRPEVMAPMANTVGLVDGECAYLQPLDELQEMRRQQALRRHEHEPVAAGRDLSFGPADCVERHAAV